MHTIRPHLLAPLFWLALLLVSAPVAGQAPHAVKISQTEGGFGGQLKGSFFGSSVEVLGDLDGDGTIDIAVGAPGDNTNGEMAGAVWILFLNSDGTVKAEQKITMGEGGFDGVVAAHDMFGFSMTTVGDLNRDGYNELVVSAPNERLGGSRSHTGSHDGFLSVLFLGPDGRVKKQTRINPPGGVEGHVTSLGDVNSDGVQDLLVQGIFDDNVVNKHGQLRVVHLHEDGSQLGNPVAIGVDPGVDRVGLCEPVDDLDRDGNRDLVCGGSVVIDNPGQTSATVEEALAIIFPVGDDGRALSPKTIDMRDWGISFQALAWSSENGPSYDVSTLRGPTLSGVIVGTPTASGNTGAVMRVFLNTSLEPVIVQNMSDVIPGFASDIGEGVSLGRSVAVGDLDGNGREDIFVGARTDNDGGARRGAVWVLFNPPLPGPFVDSTKVTKTAVVDADIRLESSIFDLKAVDEARLHFRRGGDPNFFSGAMTAVDDTSFVFDIPGFVAGPRGIEYYVTATNESGAKSRSPETGFHSVPIYLPAGTSMPAPAGAEADGYRLISVPLELDDANATTVLEASFGPYNPKRWRFFQSLPGSGRLRELDGEHEISLLPGNAYWLLVKDAGRILESGPGTTVSTAPTDSFRLGITSGYNVIANPYNFPVRLDQIANRSGRTLSELIAEGLVDEVLTYQGDWVTVADTLEPFEGYLVYPMSECIDTWECSDTSPGALYVYSDASVISPPESSKRQSPEQPMWTIRIAAEQGEARDRYNYASVSPAAEVGWDRMDRPEPLMIGDYVSVSFPHPEWGRAATHFRCDARPELKSGDSWSLEVRSHTTSPVHLFFDQLETLPEHFEIRLVDDASRVEQNLRENNEYAVAGPGEGQSINLALIVGTPEYLAGREEAGPTDPPAVEPLGVYPNPFQGSTSIHFVVDKPGPVYVSVYDVLGRRIRNLINGKVLAEGPQSLVWDGFGQDNKPLASGLFFVLMETGGRRYTSAVIHIN